MIELAKTGHQPLEGKGLQQGNSQRCRIIFGVGNFLDCCRQPADKVPHHWHQGVSGIGQNQSAPFTFKQFYVPQLFDVLDLVAYGALGNEQFFGRPGISLNAWRRLQERVVRRSVGT